MEVMIAMQRQGNILTQERTNFPHPEGFLQVNYPREIFGLYYHCYDVNDVSSWATVIVLLSKVMMRQSAMSRRRSEYRSVVLVL